MQGNSKLHKVLQEKMVCETVLQKWKRLQP